MEKQMKETVGADQGDVFFVKVEGLSDGLRPVERKDGRFVLAEGEVTGHCHAISEDISLYEDARGVLYLKTDRKATVKHEEHHPVSILPGIYRVGIVQEYDPFLEEARSVAD